MYLALGDKERAIDEMGRAYRERAGNDIALIKVDPMLDDLPVTHASYNGAHCRIDGRQDKIAFRFGFVILNGRAGATVSKACATGVASSNRNRAD